VRHAALPGPIKRALDTLDRGQQALVPVVPRGGAGCRPSAPAAQRGGEPDRE
jgi:hypothetical protein